MKDWANLAVSVVNLATALVLLRKATKETKRKEPKNAAVAANVNRFPESKGIGPCSPPNHNINGLDDTICRRAYAGLRPL
jgi:hypothetical protein